MSVREAALVALKTVLVAACPGADVKRNADVPTDVGPGGLVILRDGDPGEPEVTLSPPSYAYEHRAVVEIVIEGGPGRGARARSSTPFSAISTWRSPPTRRWAAPWTIASPKASTPTCSAPMPAHRSAPRAFNVTLLYVTSSPLG